MTFATGHLRDVITGLKADHDFGEANLKMIPKALENPVAIIASNTKPNSSIVAILNLSYNNKPMFAAVEIDGFGTLNGKRIDSNAITSIHTRGNSVNLLVDAIANDSNTSAKLFYINKKSATALLNASGVQFPGGKTVHDGTIHSIRENTSFVKSKFQDVTETQQFKRWFGDWKKHPEAASKVVNADGTPKVVYHQTDAEFTVFDTRREGAGTRDSGTPFGIFMKSSNQDIGVKGKKQMALYADIRNPLQVENREELSKKIRNMSTEYDRLIKSEMQYTNVRSMLGWGNSITNTIYMT